MNDIIEITENNNYLLNEFLNNSIPGTFRYFNKRPYSIIKNHIFSPVRMCAIRIQITSCWGC